MKQKFLEYPNQKKFYIQYILFESTITLQILKLKIKEYFLTKAKFKKYTYNYEKIQRIDSAIKNYGYSKGDANIFLTTPQLKNPRKTRVVRF